MTTRRSTRTDGKIRELARPSASTDGIVSCDGFGLGRGGGADGELGSEGLESGGAGPGGRLRASAHLWLGSIAGVVPTLGESSGGKQGHGSAGRMPFEWRGMGRSPAESRRGPATVSLKEPGSGDGASHDPLRITSDCTRGVTVRLGGGGG